MAGTRESRPGEAITGAANNDTNATPWTVPLGPDRLLVGGEWVDASQRPRNWRDAVDLGDAPRHVVYAAGVEDGIALAAQLTREYAELVMEHRGTVDALEQAYERRYRSAS